MPIDEKVRSKIYYLLYDGYAGFELVFVANNLSSKMTATWGSARNHAAPWRTCGP
jgi:hypothetical protein